MIICQTEKQHLADRAQFDDSSFEQQIARLEHESCRRRVSDNIILLKKIFNNAPDKDLTAKDLPADNRHKEQ